MDSQLSSSPSPLDNVQREDGTLDLTTENEHGILPILLDFSTLGVQGSEKSSAVYSGGSSSSSCSKNGSSSSSSSSTTTNRGGGGGWAVVQRIVDELRTELRERRGFQTRLADWTTVKDDDEGGDGADATSGLMIPIMRLPANWDDYLRSSDDNKNNDHDDDQPVFRTADQGGNGISSILWGQWIDDVFGASVRMREIAVYQHRRQPAANNNNDHNNNKMTYEQAFHVPERSVALPMGNDALTRHERQFQDYQVQRMMEAEAIHDREMEGANDDDGWISEGDDMMINC
jgi:hypothetical protein